MERRISLEEAIRAAFAWDVQRICTPEVMERVWDGFCDKLEDQRIEDPEVVARMRGHLPKERQEG